VASTPVGLVWYSFQNCEFRCFIWPMYSTYSDMSPFCGNSPNRMGYGDVLVHQRGGPRFRKHRRIVQDHFSAKSLANYTSLQRKEVYTTLANIGDSPHDFDRHLKRYDSQYGPRGRDQYGPVI